MSHFIVPLDKFFIYNCKHVLYYTSFRITEKLKRYLKKKNELEANSGEFLSFEIWIIYAFNTKVWIDDARTTENPITECQRFQLPRGATCEGTACSVFDRSRHRLAEGAKMLRSLYIIRHDFLLPPNAPGRRGFGAIFENAATLI